MAYSKQEILDELVRRRGLSTEGATTPIVPNPQGPSAAEFISQLPVGERNMPSGQDTVRSLLRGATLGLSDSIGSAAAALPASFGSDRALGDVYADIRDSVQHEEDLMASETPQEKEALEVLGMLTSLAATGATGAVKGGLRRAGGRVGGGAKSGSSAARGATVKPHYTAAQVAAHAAKRSPKTFFADKAADAVAGGVVGEAIADDPVMGALGALAIDTPLGRMGLSRLMKRMFGDNARVATYVGLHPATRNKVRGLSETAKSKFQAARARRRAKRS